MTDAFDVVAVEGEVAQDHDLQNDAQRKRVELEVVLLAFEHLWRHVVGRALET